MLKYASCEYIIRVFFLLHLTIFVTTEEETMKHCMQDDQLSGL